MQKFIITGAPGTGKTSIINHLKKKGYNCIDEISREIISEQIAINGEVLPWKNLSAFSESCLLYTSPSPRDATLSRMPSSA